MEVESMTAAGRRRLGRDEILDGAGAILDAGQVGDLTVDALARTLRMSKSTLYKHFTSKEELVVGLVDRLCRSIEDDLTGESTLSGPAEAALDTWTRICCSFLDQLPRAVILQPNKLPPACQSRVRRVRKQLRLKNQDILGRGKADGKFPNADAALAATAWMAAAWSAGEAAARGEVDVDRAGAVKAVDALVRPGLG